MKVIRHCTHMDNFQRGGYFTHMKKLLLFVAVLFSTATFAKTEPWYWGFGLGPGYSFYMGDFSSAVSAARTQSGASFGGDLGFYWPTGEGKTIIGPALVGATDAITPNSRLHNGILAFSAIHTFGTEPGDGFFIRGDAGIGTVSASFDLAWGSVTYASASGLGLAGTLGYGILASDETRLLFQLRTQVILARNSAGAIIFTFGPMF